MERNLKHAKIESTIWSIAAMLFGMAAFILIGVEGEDAMSQLLAVETAVACAIMSAITGRVAFCLQKRVEFIEALLRDRKQQEKLNIR